MRSAARPIRRGFTLIEAIATMVILAAMGSVVSSLLLTAMNGYTNAAVGAQLQTEASIAMDRIVRELRRIPRDSSVSTTAPAISSTTATSMAWNTNYSLSLSGATLNFVDAGAASRPLLRNVSSFNLQCYDQSGSALAASLSGSATQAIRRIQIRIDLQRHGVTKSLRASVYLRPTMIASGT